jgi:hypothetical protein
MHSKRSNSKGCLIYVKGVDKMRYMTHEFICPKCRGNALVADISAIWCARIDCDYVEQIIEHRGYDNTIRIEDFVVNLAGSPGIVRKIFEDGRIQVQHNNRIWVTYDNITFLRK